MEVLNAIFLRKAVPTTPIHKQARAGPGADTAPLPMQRGSCNGNVIGLYCKQGWRSQPQMQTSSARRKHLFSTSDWRRDQQPMAQRVWALQLKKGPSLQVRILGQDGAATHDWLPLQSTVLTCDDIWQATVAESYVFFPVCLRPRDRFTPPGYWGHCQQLRLCSSIQRHIMIIW